MRNKHYLELCLPSLVWKGLLGLPLSLGAQQRRVTTPARDPMPPDDLRAVDSCVIKSMEALRACAADSKELADARFVATSADGRTVPLVPGGEELPVTFERRGEYADAVLRYKLHEFDAQVRLGRTQLLNLIRSDVTAMNDDIVLP
jgi:hypothetical protein